jgi:hypothetical protein
MRRILAAMAFVLLLAPADAFAQGYLRQPVSTSPAGQNAIAEQAGVDTAALLTLYMRQLASTGQPPSQSDIDEATRQYFTNGAAVSTVPTSGPGAAYFQNGAAVMSYGASPSPTPTAAAPTATVQPAAVPAQAPPVVPVAVPQPVPVSPPVETPSAAEADTTSATTTANSAAGVTEAQAANPTSPPAAAPVINISVPAPVQPLVQTIVVPAAEPELVLQCPPPPSFFSRIAPALGGLLFGGFAVALWSRPRMIRNQRT